MRSVFVMEDLNYCEQFASMKAAKKVTTYLSRTLPDFLNFLAKSKETVMLIVEHLFSIGFWFECTVTCTHLQWPERTRCYSGSFRDSLDCRTPWNQK